MEKHLLRRSIAYVIDIFIAVALAFVCLPFMAFSIVTAPENGPMSNAGLVAMLLGAAIGFAGCYGYFLFRDGLKKGSFGKRMMGLMVVNQQTGDPCSLGASFIRNVLLLLLQAIDLIVPFCTLNGQRFGDMAAKTLVIRKTIS